MPVVTHYRLYAVCNKSYIDITTSISFTLSTCVWFISAIQFLNSPQIFNMTFTFTFLASGFSAKSFATIWFL